MQLTKSFTRVTSDLTLPEVIGPGVTSSTGGGVWGWSNVPPNATGALPLSGIAAAANSAQLDLRQAIPADAEFHIKVQYGTVGADEYFRANYRPGMTAGQRKWLDWTTRRIREQGYPLRQVLVGTRLDRIAPPGAAGKVDEAKIVLDRLKRKTFLSTERRQAERAVYGRDTVERLAQFHATMAKPSVSGTPATVQDVAWSIWRDLTRTSKWLPSGNMAVHGTTMRFRDAAPEVLGNGLIRIPLEGGGHTYLGLLIPTVNGWPDMMELPGAEWMDRINLAVHATDGVPEPVEVSIRGRNLSKSTATGLIEQAIRMLREQQNSSNGAADVEDHIAALEGRIKDLSARRIGYADCTTTWVVPGATEEECKKRCDAVVDHLHDFGIEVFRPHAIADLLYKSLLIGDTHRVQEFDALQTWHTITGSQVFAGSRVGDVMGPYVAENLGASGGPIYSQLSGAQLENKSTTTVFAGASGRGKSTGVILSGLPDLQAGALGVLTDFKGDLDGAGSMCEMFDIPFTSIDVRKAPVGALDAFSYMPPAQAASAVSDDLAAIIGAQGSNEWAIKRQAVIRQAVSTVSSREERSTADVIDLLVKARDPESKEVGRMLQQLSTDPLAAVLVGRPAPGAKLALPLHPGLVYLGFGELVWPNAATDESRWHTSERVSMLLIQSILRYITHVVRRVNGPKLIMIPELHYLTGYSWGTTFLSRHVFTGRALGENLVVDTQAVAGLLAVDGLLDNISEAHCFGVNSYDEAKAQARLLGREYDQAFGDAQKAATDGVHIWRDRKGRLTEAIYDRLCTELAEAIDTKPVREDPSTDEENAA